MPFLAQTATKTNNRGTIDPTETGSCARLTINFGATLESTTYTYHRVYRTARKMSLFAVYTTFNTHFRGVPSQGVFLVRVRGLTAHVDWLCSPQTYSTAVCCDLYLDNNHMQDGGRKASTQQFHPDHSLFLPLHQKQHQGIHNTVALRARVMPTGEKIRMPQAPRRATLPDKNPYICPGANPHPLYRIIRTTNLSTTWRGRFPGCSSSRRPTQGPPPGQSGTGRGRTLGLRTTRAHGSSCGGTNQRPASRSP